MAVHQDTTGPGSGTPAESTDAEESAEQSIAELWELDTTAADVDATAEVTSITKWTYCWPAATTGWAVPAAGSADDDDATVTTTASTITVTTAATTTNAHK